MADAKLLNYRIAPDGHMRGAGCTRNSGTFEMWEIVQDLSC